MINPALLVSAAMLQDYLVDKDTGLPLAGGIITLYQDSSRTTLKNWYEQSFNGTSYIFIPLPNPMTLSAVGTMQDDSGQDIIPFYYPYSEVDNVTPQTYYITVTDSNGEVQFVRENFPWQPVATPTNTTPTLKNYLVNNVFWRNNSPVTPSNPMTPATNQIGVIAPGANNGYSMPDISYFRSSSGATDTITFKTFAIGQLINPSNPADVTPEYYINWNCTAANTGETQKGVQIPIDLHLLSIQQAPAVFTIYGQAVGGSNNTLEIFLYQFNGSAATSGVPVQLGSTISLNTTWTQYTIPFTFPPITGATLPSTTGDDAWYIQIGVPVGVTFDINFAKPCLYIGTTVPTNEFTTYDQVDAIINSPRTGDVRVSLNSVAPYGWVLCNDGVIGPASSTEPMSIPIARYNTDVWPLYNLLWNLISTNSLPNTFYSSTGGSATIGTSAISDWTAGKQITLSKQLGSAIASAGLSGASGGITTWKVGANGGAETHTVATGEIPNHEHLGAGGLSYVLTGGSGSFSSGTPYGGTSPTTGLISGYPGGGQTNLSLVQATSFYNVFLKL